MQAAWRDNHERSIAQPVRRRTEYCLLEPGPGDVQDRGRAGQVGSGARAGEAPQGEAREVGRAHGIVSAARCQQPDPAVAADEDLQCAIDVDNLDKLAVVQAARAGLRSPLRCGSEPPSLVSGARGP